MPVTATAKRALRSSKRKEMTNKIRVSRLEIAIRKAQKSPSKKTIQCAISLVDKNTKHNIIHKNKAAKMKSGLAKLMARPKKTPSKTSASK